MQHAAYAIESKPTWKLMRMDRLEAKKYTVEAVATPAYVDWTSEI